MFMEEGVNLCRVGEEGGERVERGGERREGEGAWRERMHGERDRRERGGEGEEGEKRKSGHAEEQE